MHIRIIPYGRGFASRLVAGGIAAVITFGALSCLAGPSGGVVVGGQGSISNPNSSTTLIDQTSRQLRLDWNSFNITSGELVRFIQPTSSAVALNRIFDQNPSQIFGRLDANGMIVLINPNGIVFGRSSQVNVGALVASSLDLTSWNPTTGHLSLSAANDRAGAVINEGALTAAPGGSITLLGGTVLNNGLIVADYGDVNLAAGRTATLDFFGGGLLRLQADGNVLHNPNGAGAAVENAGEIQANGGQVLLTARAAQGVFANAVNNAGVIRANRIDNSGGTIRLVGPGGTVTDSGTLDASGVGASSTGGTVEVLGHDVALTGNARVDVSGAAGGGTALIGGGLHGSDASVLNAATTSIGSGVNITADARAAGNGGTVVAWGDELMSLQGSISARGGAQSGNGGLVETSSHHSVLIDSAANASGPRGLGGTWLIDPTNITIATGSGAFGTNAVGASTINTALNSGTSVTLDTSTATAPPGTPPGAGTIVQLTGATIVKDGGAAATLRLNANSSVTLNDSISDPSGALSLTVNSGGAVTLGTVSLGGNLTIGGFSGGTPTAAAGGAITQTGVLSVTGTTGINAGAHAITLTDTGNVLTGAVSLTGGVTQITNSAALTLGTLNVGALTAIANAGAPPENGGLNLGSGTVGGNLVAMSNGGAITESAGGLQVTGGGTSNVNASAGSITLTDVNNAFSGAVTLTGATTQVTDAAGMTLGTLNVGALTAIANAGAPAVNGSLNLGTGTVGGSLVAASNGGAITESAGGLQVTGGGTSDVNAGAGSITLTDAGNHFTGAVTLASTGTGVSIFDSGALTLGAPTLGTNTGITAIAGGTLTLPAVALSTGTGSIDLESNGGTLSTAGDLSTTSGTIRLVGSAGLTISNNLATTLTTGGTLTLASTNSPITQTAGAIAIADTINVNAGTGAITLNNVDDSGALAVSLTGGSTQINDPVKAISLGTLNVGALTVNSAGGINLGTGSIAGALTANAPAGGAITENSGGLQVAGTSSINAGAINSSIALDDPGNHFGGAVSLSNSGAGNVALLVDSGALTLGTLNLGSDLVVSSGGALNLGTGTIGGALSVLIAGGPVTQTGALTVAGTTAINAGSGGTANAITLTSNNALQGTVSLVGGATRLTNTASNQTVTLNTTGPTLLDAGTNALSVSGPTPAGSGDLTINSGPLAFGALNVGNNLTVTASGEVTQSGALAVVGTSNINAGTNPITLTSNNTLTGAVSLTGSAVQLVNNQATVLGTTDATTSLAVTTGGSLSQTGGITAPATTLTFTGANSDVTLDQINSLGETSVLPTGSGSIRNLTLTNAANANAANPNASQGLINAFGTAATLPTGSVTLDGVTGVATPDPTGIMLPGYSLGGSLSVTAGGPVGQAGAGLLTVTGATGINAGTNAINLPLANMLTGTVSLTGGTTQLTTATPATVVLNGTAATTLDIGGSLDVAGTAASLATNSGAVTFGTTAVGSLNVTTTGSLSQTGGITSSTTQLNFTGQNSDVILNQVNSLPTPLGVSYVAGAIRNLNLTNGNASQALVSTFGTAPTGTVTLDAPSTIDLPAYTLGGNLSVTANGAVAELAGPLQVAGTTNISAGTNTITLTQNNALTGMVTLSGGVTGLTNTLPTTVVLNNTGSTSLNSGGNLLSVSGGAAGLATNSGALIFAVTGVGGDLTAVAAGPVTQTGPLTVALTTGIDAGANPITLTLNNALTGAVSLTGGATQLTNTASSQTVALNTTGSTVLNAGTNAFSISGTVSGSSDLTIDSGTLSFGATTVGGNLMVVTSGAATQAAPLTVAGTTSINAGTNAITLSSNNALTGAVSLTGSATQLTNTASSQTVALNTTGSTVLNAGTNAFSVSGTVSGSSDLTIDSGTLSFGATTVGGNLVVTSGAVTQAAPLTVAGTSTINAGANSITLADAANHFTGPVTLASTGTGVSIFDSGALTLGAPTLGTNTGITAIAGGTLTLPAVALSTGTGGIDLESSGGTLATAGDLSTTSGAIRLVGSGGITIDNSLTTASAGGTLTLASTNGAITQSAGTISTADNITVNAGTGAITLSNVNPGGQPRTVSLTGGTTQITDPVEGIGLGTLNVGALTVSSVGGIDLGTGSVAGTLTVNANGVVTENSGGLQVAGPSSIHAGANSIGLDDPGNHFGGAISLSNSGAGNTALLADSGALTLGTLTLGGGLTATSHGALNLGTGSVGGNLMASSNNGLITETAGGLQVGGTSSINAGASPITLTDAANHFTGAVSLSNTGAGNAVQVTDPGNLTLGVLNVGGNLTATSTGALNLGTGSVGGSLTAASNGAITESGSLKVAGATTLAAAANGDISLADANDFSSVAVISGHNVTLNDMNALTLGNFDIAGTFTATAGGTISDSGRVTASALNLTGSAIGTGNLSGGTPGFIDTQVGSLNLKATSGGIFVNNLSGSVTVTASAPGNIELITRGPNANLTVQSVRAGGDALLTAGDSILAANSTSLVEGNLVQLRAGLENAAGTIGALGALLRVNASQAPQSLQLVVPSANGKDPTNTPNVLANVSPNRLVFNGNQLNLYSAPFGNIVSGGQFIISGVQLGEAGTQEGRAGSLSLTEASEAGGHRVLYIDWSSFDPNVSLFGTVNPAVCLPKDQREEDSGQGGCTAWQPRPDATPSPVRVASVLTRDGWKLLGAFENSPATLNVERQNSHQ